MLLSEFDYPLPKELIAQEGLPNREDAKLLVLGTDGAREHRQIKNLPDYFRKGDLLIVNNTRVAKAKLIGKKETGGKVDCLVLPRLNGSASDTSPVRDALIRGSNIKPGMTLIFPINPSGDGSKSGAELKAKVVENTKGAQYKIEFDRPDQIEAAGELPIPPYIKKKMEDQSRYQTVYSKIQGSLAAPTAGLHFTPELMKQLEDKGVEFAYLTLHVGIGTFAPIRVDTVEEWKMHPEYFDVTPETAAKINAAIEAGRRCFAVGTTSIRTLESATQNGRVAVGSGWTDIYIYPGHRFAFPYAGALTNFHLPESTLLLLACAFAGKEWLMDAYKEAIEKRYRFFSLGDGMLIYR